MYVWGRNHRGQVGNGTHEDCYTPTAVLTNVKSVKFSTIGTTLAVTKDGNLYMWGHKHSEEPVKFLENVKSAELPDAQEQVVAAITEDGSLYMWGDNTWGQIGNGSTFDVIMSTYKVLENVKSVKCTYWGTTLAITNDDELYMWGYNGRGQVGNGSRSSAVTEPEKILVNVKSAVCEGEVSYAITKSGKLYMWGWNGWNQIEYGKGVYVTEPYRKIFMGKTSVSAVTTDDVTDVTSETESSTETLAKNFTGLNPGEIYNIYVMKNSEAENKFASENLYYVNQCVADKDGNLSISCKIHVAESEAEFVVAGIAELENTPGDVNSDGKINALDALRVLKSVADMIKLTLEEECAADVNADEKADALDALLILKYTAGMIRNFG